MLEYSLLNFKSAFWKLERGNKNECKRPRNMINLKLYLRLMNQRFKSYCCFFILEKKKLIYAVARDK